MTPEEHEWALKVEGRITDLEATVNTLRAYNKGLEAKVRYMESVYLKNYHDGGAP